MFRLVLNAPEAETGNYWQTCFVWPVQCFKQIWIHCQQQQQKNNKTDKFILKILSFPVKLVELEKTAMCHHVMDPGSTAHLA